MKCVNDAMNNQFTPVSSVKNGELLQFDVAANIQAPLGALDRLDRARW